MRGVLAHYHHDAQATLDWPLPADAPPRVVAAHAHFARTPGLSRLLSVPLVRQDGENEGES